jgi:hypothetical protein
MTACATKEHIPDNFANVLLSRWLLCIEKPETSEQLALVVGVGLELRLLVGIDKQHGKVATAAALASLEQRLCDVIEDIDRGCPVGRLGVSCCYHARLLLGLVELALADAGLQAGDDLFDLVAFTRHFLDGDVEQVATGAGEQRCSWSGWLIWRAAVLFVGRWRNLARTTAYTVRSVKGVECMNR